jgi:hypothetical protein
MAIIDGDGNGLVSGPKGPIIIADKYGKPTLEGIDHYKRQSLMIFEEYLRDQVCLVSNGTYHEFLDQLLGLYNGFFVHKYEERADALNNIDSITSKLSRGFVSEEVRKKFGEYSQRRKMDLVELLEK